MAQAPILTDGPDDAFAALVLAHGAGAAMDAPFMNEIATLLAMRGMRVVRFEFPYMARRRREGTRSPPDRMPVLEESLRAIVSSLSRATPLLLGGKSMGARVATQLADELAVSGAVALGYPFHPPKRPAQLRVAHLSSLRTPCLVVQGTRDPFGVPAEVATYPLSPSVRVHWIDGADHSLAAGPKQGRTTAQNIVEAADVIAAFARACAR